MNYRKGARIDSAITSTLIFKGAFSHNEPQIPEKVKNPKSNNSYEITNSMELLNNNSEIAPPLLEPILKRVGISSLAGSSDTGKSTLLRQLAINISAGSEHFLGFKINAVHKSVIFVPTEDNKEDIREIMKIQAKYYRPEQLKGLRFMFKTTNLIENIRTELKRQPADMVIIDAFMDAFGEDVKENHKVRNFLDEFDEIAEEFQCQIMFLHHTGKGKEDLAPSKNNLLGGQSFEAKMRLVLELRTNDDDNSYRWLHIVKGNYLPSSMKKKGFLLKFDEPTLSFHNTRVEPEPKVETDREKAIRLRAEGKSYKEIRDELKLETIKKVQTLLN